jgi:hypothetical protein
VSTTVRNSQPPAIVTPRWRHDLRNQLGIVLGFSDLMLEELAADDPRRPGVQEIHAAAMRALELLAQAASSEPDRPPSA